MSFVANTLVVLRESLEAFLILGILIGIVSRLGRPEARRPLYLGAVAGLAVSLVAGIAVVAGAREAVEEGGEFVEVAAGLLAVAILTYMVVWMYRHTITMMGGLQKQARAALADGRTLPLAGIAFVAVLREGVETAALLATSPDSGLMMLTAVAVGILGSAAAAYLLFSGVVRLNVRTFFAATGAMLVLFAAWMLFGALAELAEEALGLGEAGEVGVAVLAILYAVGMLGFLVRPMLRKGIGSGEGVPDADAEVA